MNPWLIFILVVLIGSFLFDWVVERLNLTSIQLDLPKSMADVYSADDYRKSIEYLRANTSFSLLQRLIFLPLFLSFVLLEGFAIIEQWAIGLAPGAGPIGIGLIFFGILSALSRLVSLPFSIYRTFVIEERFGFNRTTFRTYLLDGVKGALLGVLIGGPILAGLIWFFEALGPHAWWVSWVGLMSFQVLMLIVAPIWIMPLFNRYTPLEAGELREAIEAFAQKQSFDLDGIFKMDGSKRSSKSNAFFTGFGKSRRIVLFDTLIENHTTSELVAVLAHEIGHYQKKHIQKSLLLSSVVMGMGLYAFSFLLRTESIFLAFGMVSTSVYGGLVFASLLFSPISRFLSIAGNILSRKHEFEADQYAAEKTGQPEEMICALKKLSVKNLSPLTPHWLKVFVEYSHPPVMDRIAALRGGGPSSA